MDYFIELLVISVENQLIFISENQIHQCLRRISCNSIWQILRTPQMWRIGSKIITADFLILYITHFNYFFEVWITSKCITFTLYLTNNKYIVFDCIRMEGDCNDGDDFGDKICRWQFVFGGENDEILFQLSSTNRAPPNIMYAEKFNVSNMNLLTDEWRLSRILSGSLCYNISSAGSMNVIHI